MSQNYPLGEYSQMLDNDMWNAVGSEYDKDYDFDELLVKINSADFFRPFSERLLAYYNEIHGKNFGGVLKQVKR